MQASDLSILYTQRKKHHVIRLPRFVVQVFLVGTHKMMVVVVNAAHSSAKAFSSCRFQAFSPCIDAGVSKRPRRRMDRMLGRACCFGCLKAASKSVQRLLNGIEAAVVLTLEILK